MRTRLITVVGSSGELTPEIAELSERLGAALVRAEYGIVTAGRGGVAEAVCRGAIRKRGKADRPPVIGLLAGVDPEAGNAYLDAAMPTGLGQGAHSVLATAGEAMVCVGGGTSAIAEVALARKANRPVISLTPSGGAAGLVAKVMESVEAIPSIEGVIARLEALLPR